MVKKLKVAMSPLSGTIYAGNLIKNETMWGANKQDVTMDCLVAVAEHILKKYPEGVEITDEDGNVVFEIVVKRGDM
ncbi:hypothetical protein VPH166E361_0029 [Vibrio phage 166E36-1]